MSTEKLPEWPDRDYFAKATEYGPAMTIYGEADYKSELARAALARMEALVKLVKELQRRRRNQPLHIDGRIDDEIDALLAACARKEANNVRD